MTDRLWIDGTVRTLSNWAYKAKNLHYWDGYLLDTYERVLKLPLPALAMNGDKVAAIVEPRQHQHLPYVINNVMHFLGPGWALVIFHGTGNRAMVEHIAQKFTPSGPLLIDLGVPNLSIEEYNRLLTSIDRFWNKLPPTAETVLVFQTDSLLRRPFRLDVFPPGVHYLGAPWPPGCRPMGLEYGNGGISLRSKRAMIRVLTDHPREPDKGLPEDVHFSYWVRQYPDAVMPSVEEAALFSTEYRMLCDSFAVHPNLYSLTPDELRKLLHGIKYPEA